MAHGFSPSCFSYEITASMGVRKESDSSEASASASTDWTAGVEATYGYDVRDIVVKGLTPGHSHPIKNTGWNVLVYRERSSCEGSSLDPATLIALAQNLTVAQRATVVAALTQRGGANLPPARALGSQTPAASARSSRLMIGSGGQLVLEQQQQTRGKPRVQIQTQKGDIAPKGCGKKPQKDQKVKQKCLPSGPTVPWSDATRKAKKAHEAALASRRAVYASYQVPLPGSDNFDSFDMSILSDQVRRILADSDSVVHSTHVVHMEGRTRDIAEHAKKADKSASSKGGGYPPSKDED